MGHNDHIDFELYELIQELVDEGEIEEGSPAFGVAQQVIHQGHESLSPKQRGLYKAVIEPALAELAKQHKINEIMHSARD